MTLLALLPAVLLAGAAGAAAGQASPRAAPVDEEEISRVVWAHAPEVLEARRQLVGAEAVAAQAHLLPNPELGASWATIPIGTHNPPDLPFGQIPSYGVGLSQLLEIGKRGPRRRVAEALANADHFRLEDAYRRSFFAVLESLTDQASATARAAALSRLAEGSAESLSLQRLRAERGDAAGLDVDRIEVDHLRLLSRIIETDIEREATRRTCAQALGQPCPRIDDPGAALGFLERGLETAPLPSTISSIDDRPDVKALVLERAASAEARLLATRLRIPDPTLALSFVHDQHTVAGNQANSLTLSLGLPLPLFDRGQVAERRAEHEGAVLDAALASRRAAARATFETAARQLELARVRAHQLDQQALPRARSVVTWMEAAARRGGAAWPEVLLARRALEELQLERIDVAAEAQKLLLTLRQAAGTLPHPHSPFHPHEGK